jgi:hypothetical protein
MGDRHDDGRRVLLPLEVGVEAPRDRGVLWTLIGVALVVGAVLVAPLPLFPVGARPIAVAAVCFLGLLALATRRFLARPSPRKPAAAIALDLQGIWRASAEGETTPIARWDEPFGVLVLVNPARTRAVLAFTSPLRTRLVAVRIEAGAAGAWLDRAVAITEADLDEALSGFRHGFLTGRSAETLLCTVERRDATAIGRIDIVDANGARVTFEGDKLGVHDKVIDLSEPV